MPVGLAEPFFADEPLEGAADVEDWFLVAFVALVHDVLNPLLLPSFLPLTSEIFALELSLLSRQPCLVQVLDLPFLLLLQFKHLLLSKLVAGLSPKNFPLVKLLLVFVLQQLKLKRVELEEVLHRGWRNLRHVYIEHMINALERARLHQLIEVLLVHIMGLVILLPRVR